MRSNGISGKAWLKQQFKFEYCAECGGDAEHHTPVIVLGNWFARCDYGPSAETEWEYHPIIKAFRERGA